ncbi:hypothetical protein SUGI_0253610 [Cryptomeria japonica]|nr:hypothetical protein SUGI_0253610 [Cryptomeria japonica]
MFKKLASLFFFLLLSGFELSEGARSMPNEFTQKNRTWSDAKKELARADVEEYNGVPKSGEFSFAMKSTEPVKEAMRSPVVAKSCSSKRGDAEQEATISAPSPGAGH